MQPMQPEHYFFLGDLTLELVERSQITVLEVI
jgi:hypothetical protein